MNRGILLQSLDSTRFEDKDDLEFGFNLVQARTEVLTALLFGYKIVLPQAHLLGSLASIEILNDIINPKGTMRDCPFNPFVPAYPSLYTPEKPKDIFEYAKFYWKYGGAVSSLFCKSSVSAEIRQELCADVTDAFLHGNYVRFTSLLELNPGFSDQIEQFVRYMHNTDEKLFEIDNKSIRDSIEISHYDALSKASRKLSSIPSFRESKDYDLLEKGMNELDKIVRSGNVDKNKFSRALFFNNGEDIFGRDLWGVFKSVIESNYTDNMKRNYSIRRAVRSSDWKFQHQPNSLYSLAFDNVDLGIRAPKVIPQVSGDFDMKVLWDLYSEKEFIDSAKQLHTKLSSNNAHEEARASFEQHAKILEKYIEDLTFDLVDGTFIVKPKKTITDWSKALSGIAGGAVSDLTYTLPGAMIGIVAAQTAPDDSRLVVTAISSALGAGLANGLKKLVEEKSNRSIEPILNQQAKKRVYLSQSKKINQFYIGSTMERALGFHEKGVDVFKGTLYGESIV